jgi:putative transposase
VVQTLATDRAYQSHLAQTAAIDFFTVPTATFRALFVLIVLAHERRRVAHFGVTEHPTQEWTMQQMREGFSWDQAPRFVLLDRDAIYGRDFAAMIRDMGMEEVLTAPRSPWQNPFVESGLRGRGKYLATVDCATAIPNLSSSP